MAQFGILINAAEAIAPPIGLAIGFADRPNAFGLASILSLLAIPAFSSYPKKTGSSPTTNTK